MHFCSRLIRRYRKMKAIAALKRKCWSVCKQPKQTKSLGTTFSIRSRCLFVYLLYCPSSGGTAVRIKTRQNKCKKSCTNRQILSCQHCIYLDVRNCGKFMRKTLANIPKKTFIKTHVLSSDCSNENMQKYRIRYFNNTAKTTIKL